MKTNMNLIEVANFFNMVLWSCLVSDHDDILFQSALSDMLGNMLISLVLAENHHLIIRALYLILETTNLISVSTALSTIN